ncbi:hypothetical protein [uncultured Winogradskyella sp.]|nr:hypothetical protein [uncultured Winogradskyella sp.]
MDYKKEDENLEYLKQKPNNNSYKTIISAGILIVIILILGIVFW